MFNILSILTLIGVAVLAVFALVQANDGGMTLLGLLFMSVILTANLFGSTPRDTSRGPL